jgi:cell division protein FtsI/penicillin-binding protein 2
MLVLLFVLLAGFGVLTWRLAVVQMKEAPRLAELAAKKYQRHIVLPARRGTIRDVNDEFLAFDESVNELYTDRTHLREIITVRHHLAAIRGVKAADLRAQLGEAETLAAYYGHVARVLAAIVPTPEAELRKMLASDKPEIVLARKVPDETARQWELLFKAEHVIGVHLRPAVERSFPAEDRLALFIGDTDSANHGRWGVEKLMDGMLSGVPGEQFIERDRAGHELPAYRGQVVEPRHGHDIHITIDMQLQDIVESICDRAFLSHGAKRAIIAVTDVHTGSILAAAARPHRDSSNPDVNTWTNLVIAGNYEPGSTFKVVTLAAALDKRKVTPTDIIDCEQMFYSEPSLKVKLSDDEPLGRQTVRGVLVHSSNIGTYKISKRVGREGILEYAQRFGFGSRTGVGLTGESPGSINTGRWSNTTYSRMPIGYEVNATVLQVCMAYGAIANGGTLMQARIIDRITGPDGKTEVVPPQPVGQACSAATAAHLRDFLEGVVLEGTGSRAVVPGIRVAGKTGTSRRYDPEKKKYIDDHFITSFAGFAPVEKPQIACVVMIDDPVGAERDLRGGKIAAPIFAEVVREALHHLTTRHQKRMNLAQKGGQQ